MNQKIFELFQQSLPHLRRAFPDLRGVTFRELGGEEELWKVTVLLPRGVADPEKALRSFDEAWWVLHCHLSDGGLVFDYQIEGA